MSPLVCVNATQHRGGTPTHRLAAAKLNETHPQIPLKTQLKKAGIELAKCGEEIVLKKGGKNIAKILTKEVLGRVVTRFIGVASVVFIISAATEAKAQGKSNGDAVEAAMREMVDADLWEAGFNVTVINGSDKVWNAFVPGMVDRPRVKAMLDELPPEQRAGYIKEYLDDAQPFREGARQITGQGLPSWRDVFSPWNRK